MINSILKSDCAVYSSRNNIAGNRLPPIPHTDVPTWQKPITNFFNTGGLKSKDSHIDPDDKTKQDTDTSKIQQKYHEKGEPAQSSSSSCYSGIETDHQEKRSQANSELEKNEQDSSVNKDVSNNKTVTNSLEKVSQKSPSAGATAKKVNCDENDPVNENSHEADISTTENHEVNEPVSQLSVEHANNSSEVKQNEVLALSNKGVEITDGSYHTHNSDEKNESVSITESLDEASDKENMSVSPVGGNCAEGNNSCKKGAESGDGEKEQAGEEYDVEPAAKKIKT
ncbi:unnamed protein product [Callosobruchus maculatus]|uniref:Uncharacterized protein n=1 Tax=Callosobruchus maculatus TaxID=64391 RepID=A0A653CPP6_CALMS|nr:unnamed protein product [Callosobruchus maculatus]